MFVRAVRFTGVTQERVDAVVARIEESDGPPPGVPATGLQVLFDAEQGTAVVLQMFDTAADMAAAEAAFSAMDPGETPGTRASVDRCEVKLERSVPGDVLLQRSAEDAKVLAHRAGGEATHGSVDQRSAQEPHPPAAVVRNLRPWCVEPVEGIPQG